MVFDMIIHLALWPRTANQAIQESYDNLMMAPTQKSAPTGLKKFVALGTICAPQVFASIFNEDDIWNIPKRPMHLWSLAYYGAVAGLS